MGMADQAAARLRYSNGAILLHWTIAILILYNLFTGFLHDVLPRAWFQFHVSSGVTILVLTVIRIVWRLTHKPPPFLPMAKWEKWGANIVHFLLYCAMLLSPLTGWAMISAHVDKPAPVEQAAGAQTPVAGAAVPRKPHKTMVWGLVELPKLGPVVRIADQPDGAAKIKAAHELFEARHETMGFIFLGLLFLHLAGALKHQFMDKERELARMGLGKTEAAHWDPAE
jgi:cytochrome b561